MGKRVGARVTTNFAARVGSIVLVTNGVGVGGASTTGRSTGGSMLTKADHTQATPPGTPGYSTMIQSPPGERPFAGTFCPTNSTPTLSYVVFGPERRLICGSGPGTTIAIGPLGVLVTVATACIFSRPVVLADTFEFQPANKTIPSKVM